MNSNPSDTSPSTTTVLTFIAMTVVCMGIVIGMCVRLAQALEPTVGDIAEFTPGQTPDDLPDVNVTAAEGGRTCVLSSDVIAKDGGSLMVIARRPDGGSGYVVHWAGPHTSAGSTDCGTSADLTVSRPDLLSLAGIAGGFGIHPGRRANG